MAWRRLGIKDLDFQASLEEELEKSLEKLTETGM